MGEIDDWYIQERFPTEDCLLYPAKCSECIAERKQCLLNLFTGKYNEKETSQNRDEHNDKSSEQVKESEA